MFACGKREVWWPAPKQNNKHEMLIKQIKRKRQRDVVMKLCLLWGIVSGSIAGFQHPPCSGHPSRHTIPNIEWRKENLIFPRGFVQMSAVLSADGTD